MDMGCCKYNTIDNMIGYRPDTPRPYNFSDYLSNASVQNMSGTAIYRDGKIESTHKDPTDIEQDKLAAGIVQRLYEKAINSDLGKKVSSILKNEGYMTTPVEGYVVVELDNKNALAAYISNGAKSIVAMGKKYLNKLVKNPAQSLMAMVHEYAHAHKKDGKNAGENEAYGSVAKAAEELAEQSTGIENRVYTAIAQASRQGQSSYGNPSTYRMAA
jgi:hypothetical protein